MAKFFMFAHFCVSPDSITFGPAIRIWEIAKALTKKGHAVTICQKDSDASEEEKDGIKLIKYSQEALNNIKNFDLAYVQIWLNDRDIFEKLDKIPIIVDIYAPYLIEHVYYPYDIKKEDTFWRFTDDIVLSTLVPMQYGDFFICASEAQRKYYLGMLSILGRVNPYNKGDIIKIVPFGTREIKSGKNEPVLRKRIPKYKKIILWLSSFYPWLDPLKAGKIMYELLRSDSGYALAVVGAKSPFVHPSMYEENYDNFYRYAKEKNMIDTTVFFFDWLDQKDIPKAYDESSFLIVTSEADTLETEFSFRVRMMEALSAGLPIISTGGDIVSELVSMNNLGLVISGTEPKKAAEKIMTINDKDMKKMRSNIKSFSKDYSWEKLIGPIEDFCRKPSKDHLKKKIMFESLINERRDLTLQLRKEVDEKEGHIRKFEASLKNKEDALISAEMRLSSAQGRINELGAHCEMLEKRSNGLRNEIDALNLKVGKFQGSIVYPYYRFTSSIGKSGFGKLLQRLLK